MRMRWMTPGALVAAAVFLCWAAPADGEPSVSGLVVRNHSVLEPIYPGKYAAPPQPTGPVSLVGVRNGTFAAQLVVSNSGAPIKGLRAAATDLKGAGTIPASAVQVRYALPDGAPPKRDEPGAFDSLDEVPPAEVPLYKGNGAVQPIWLTVSVPGEARGGDYAGTVTISAEGAGAVRVPLKLRVVDWTLPHVNDYSTRMDFVQSPESVALAYGVEMWSEQHLKLLERTFSLLAPLADKTLYVSAIRRTHFGNEHAVIRWYRDDNGELIPDFTNAEKYLDVAVRHLGKIPGVILLCWEPITSMGHAGGSGGAGRTSDKPIQYTLWDPKTGQQKKRTGPAWGTPEARKFWKRFTDGIRPILAKRGLGDSMLLGLVGDSRPTATAMDDVTNGDKSAQWAIHSHFYATEWKGYKIGMCIALWGIHLNIVDPSVARNYGWQKKNWMMYYPREFALTSSLSAQRYKAEMWIGALQLFEWQHRKRFPVLRGSRGLGRIGADFWRVVKSRRGRTASLAGRYPESYWGQLNLNYCIPHILGRGKNGPVPTVRSEAFREGLQDIEARVCIERALLDEAKRARLGEELAKRCRDFLDERIRWVNWAGEPRHDQISGRRSGPAGKGRLPPGWPKQNHQLYELTAEVAAKLGGS